MVDAIDEAAQYILEYKIEEPTEASRLLAGVIVACADELERAAALLSTRGSKLGDILPMVVEINRLENEADQIASRAEASFSTTISMASKSLNGGTSTTTWSRPPTGPKMLPTFWKV